MKITDVAIRKPVFAWMMMVATVVFGAVALTRMGVSQYPDVDYPTVSVSVDYEGAAPEVVVDGESGLLVADEAEMAAALRRVEELSPES